MDGLKELFHADAIWHEPGKNPLSGPYRGWEQMLGQYIELSGGTFRVQELHDVVANDEHAVSLAVVGGEREGKTMDERDMLVFHIRDGKTARFGSFTKTCTR